MTKGNLSFSVKGLIGLLLIIFMVTNCSVDTTNQNDQANQGQAAIASHDELAKETIQVLQDDQARTIILEALKENQSETLLTDLIRDLESQNVKTEFLENLLAYVNDCEVNNQQSDNGVKIPEVWLYEPENSYNLNDLLVSFPPEEDEMEWDYIKAYNLNEDIVYLDIENPPSVPVVVVDTYGYFAFQEELKRMNRMLQRAGLQSEHSVIMDEKNYTKATGYQSHKMNHVKLNDDKEPWISGRAEIYAIVSGIHPVNEQAQLYIVDMPYLDYAGNNYYPNQILIHWDTLRYNVANFQFYEKDSNTNYKDLVKALITAVGTAVSFAGPEYIIAVKVAEIANAIVDAMPDEWYTNDDDYVDSFYTLEKGRAYTNYYGASGNAQVTLVDYWYYEN
ncbi:MAG: DUF3103 domain-containing protein [Spirochaetes bacterium]|nr:DUF3103 domain-containing protein [Spirochaetota bacterium]